MAQAIDVTVQFRCDLRDLWFHREGTTSSSSDSRFDKRQDERNRVAVAARVVAVALNRNAAAIDANAGWGTVTLAKQTLRSTKSVRIKGSLND
jgi:hypothetical protein